MKNGKKPKGIPLGRLPSSLPKPVRVEIKPKRLVFPLQTRWGTLRPLVKPGGDVSAGQILAQDDGGVAPPILCPCSGKVMGIRPWATASGSQAPAIAIQCSGSPMPQTATKDDGGWKQLDAQSLIKTVMKMGIREPDSYRWPLAWRLAQPGLPPAQASWPPDISRPIEYLIINAIDRQPGTSLREAALSGRETEIADCISLLERVSGARNTVLAVKKGQPISDSLDTELGRRGIRIIMCPDIYPVALEPLLVKYITGREIPMPEGNSRMIGAAVVDVLTALKVYRAIRDASPPTLTLVQLSVPSANMDYQLWIPEGMLVSELLDQLQLTGINASKLIMGGPFLGYAVDSSDVPITAEVDSIVVQGDSELFLYENNPCINCGFCVKSCPMGLLPNEITRSCEYENFEGAEKKFLFYCIECGICAYVCPAKRPMIHLIRFGKQEIYRMRQSEQ